MNYKPLYETSKATEFVVMECVIHSVFIFLIRNTTRSDFKFYADRLIRLVIEESLNQLPYSVCKVQTPTGAIYGKINSFLSKYFR